MISQVSGCNLSNNIMSIYLKQRLSDSRRLGDSLYLAHLFLSLAINKSDEHMWVF